MAMVTYTKISTHSAAVSFRRGNRTAARENSELEVARRRTATAGRHCAIPNMKKEDFHSAEDILVQYEQSLEKDSEMKSWGQWNWSFHSARYASANRPVMLAFLKTLDINCARYTRLHLVFTRDASRWDGPSRTSRCLQDEESGNSREGIMEAHYRGVGLLGPGNEYGG